MTNTLAPSELDVSSAPGIEAPSSASAPWPSVRIANYTLFLLILTSTCAQLDLAIVPYLASHIQKDLSLSDTQLSLLLGISFGLFYTLVGLPIAWFVDRFKRKWILAIGVATWSIGTALCGAAQGFAHLLFARFLVGAGEGVNAPASYSIIGDLFKRDRFPRSIALYHLGQVLGPAIALLISASLMALLLDIAPISVPFGVVHGWQLMFMIVGSPGLLVSLLVLLTMREPQRRVIPNQIAQAARQGADGSLLSWLTDYVAALKFMALHWKIYSPMFGSLLLSSLAMGGQQWMPIFYQRTYGWGPAKLAGIQSILSLVVVCAGMLAGVVLSEWWNKKGRDDAPLRAVVMSRLVGLPALFATLMPSPWLALGLSCISLFVVGIGGPAQNAAIQTITPAEMRGKITALYLFLLNVVGVAISPMIVALFTDYVFRDQSLIRWSIFIPGIVLVPLSLWAMWAGLRPYAREVARLKTLDAPDNLASLA